MDRREFVQGIWHKSVYGNHAERGLKTVFRSPAHYNALKQ